MLHCLLLDHLSDRALNSLQTVIVAGESCDPQLGPKHYEKLPLAKLYNEYGPTEATVWCTAQLVQEQEAGESVPIGKPVANAEIILLNDHKEIVPYGEIGEIHVGGPGLSGGYLNNDRLTGEAFINWDSGLGAFKRLYKTGDLGRFNLNGELEFYGRKDQQVKIRGHRIELSEIQSVLNQFPEIDEAVVLVEDRKENKGATIESDDETDFLEEISTKLPEGDFEKIMSGIELLSESEKAFLLEELNSREQ